MMEERITSRKNAKLLHLKKLGSSSAYRKETGLFLAEGSKLFQTALASSVEIQLILRAEGQVLPDFTGDIPVITVPEDLFPWISTMKTPQGILFVGKTPKTQPPTTLPQGKYLVLDGVQDAGNLGTIWRTAWGLGASALLLLEGCASPFSPKTLRSAMGASFHVPVYEQTATETINLFQASQIPLYATALQKNSKKIEEVPLDSCAVVLGSEGQGVSPDLLEKCAETIYIPMVESCQSLNVAVVAGVVLWEMQKKKENLA